MSIKVIQPVLIVPGGEAPQADVDAVNVACWLLQQWWETRNVPNLLLYHLRPASPPCAYGKDFFFPADWYPGSPDNTPWTKAKQFLLEQYPPSELMATRGISDPDDLIYLVFLKDFDNPFPWHSQSQYSWWGWGGPMTAQDVPMRWAVVDYDLIYDLATATLEAIESQGNKAMGVLAHEEGHAVMGWQHTDIPYPNVMLSYSEWPAVNIPPFR